uniref:MPN domain-containing protein n=1 Tax=Steinernema glaseri TaxID=37863 RepID=A0A1I7Z2Y4_9BILA
MERLLQLGGLGLSGLGGSAPPQDIVNHPDTSETVYISSLALLKMLRHGRSGVPMEVMGLMLGEFTDEYTIKVVDVFAMPQSGTGVSVEAVDPVFQTKMLDMLKRTGRGEMVVGWYHSHPGFGCWLSSVDIATQQSFEALSERAVAVVIDPIQSVKGKVVIDAFRSINVMALATAQGRLAPTAEPRQTTSNLGHLVRPSLVAAIHGLGTRYYSLPISYKSNQKDQKMLQCVHKKNWAEGLRMQKFSERNKNNIAHTKDMLKYTELFNKEIGVLQSLSKKEREIKKLGRLNPKRRLEEAAHEVMGDNIVHSLGSVINSKAFH